MQCATRKRCYYSSHDGEDDDIGCDAMWISCFSLPLPTDITVLFL